MMNKSKTMTGETKKMNTYLKYGLILIICMVIGGIMGYLSVIGENKMLSVQAVVTGVICGIRAYLLPEMLILLVAEVILGEVTLMKSRSYSKMIEQAEDEEGDVIDLALEKAGALGTGIMTVIAVLAVVLLSTGYSMSYIKSLADRNQGIYLLGAMIVFLIIYVYNGFWGVRLVKLEQKYNPDRKGDPASMKFTEQWVESCDEAEKELIYQSAFRCYLTMSKCVPFIMMIAMIMHLLWNTGIAAVIFTGFIWLLMNISYLKSSVQKRRKKLNL